MKQEEKSYNELVADYAALAAENERLREAGNVIVHHARRSAYIPPRLLEDWDVAKAGRVSSEASEAEMMRSFLKRNGLIEQYQGWLEWRTGA